MAFRGLATGSDKVEKGHVTFDDEVDHVTFSRDGGCEMDWASAQSAAFGTGAQPSADVMKVVRWEKEFLKEHDTEKGDKDKADRSKQRPERKKSEKDLPATGEANEGRSERRARRERRKEEAATATVDQPVLGNDLGFPADEASEPSVPTSTAKGRNREAQGSGSPLGGEKSSRGRAGAGKLAAAGGSPRAEEHLVEFDDILAGVQQQLLQVSASLESLSSWRSRILQQSAGDAALLDSNGAAAGPAAEGTRQVPQRQKSRSTAERERQRRRQRTDLNLEELEASGTATASGREGVTPVAATDLRSRSGWCDAAMEEKAAPLSPVQAARLVKRESGIENAILAVKEKYAQSKAAAAEDVGGPAAGAEEEGERKWRSCLINPHSRFRRFWRAAALTAVVYDMWFIPLQVFDLPETAEFFLITRWLHIVFWSADLPLGFFEGFYNSEGALILDLASIRSRYLRTWFSFDLVSCMVDWAVTIMFFFDLQGTEISAIKILRLIRMARIAKFGTKMKSSDMHSNAWSIVRQFIALFSTFLYVCHVVACLWYALGETYEEGNHHWTQDYIQEQTFGNQYLVSVHWAIVQTGVGSSEVIPTNAVERAYAVAVAIGALVASSVLISNVTSFLMQLANLTADQHYQDEVLRDYLSKHAVSSPLRAKIWNHVKQSRQASQQAVDETQVQLIQYLPRRTVEALRVEVYLPTLLVHPFFKYMFQVDIGHTLWEIANQTTKQQILRHGQDLFCPGDLASSMYFVATGSITYDSRLAHCQLTAVVDPSNIRWLCEVGLWLAQWKHVGRAVASSAVCDLCRVSADDIEECLRLHSGAQNYAREFLKRAVDNKATLTDVQLDVTWVRDAAKAALHDLRKEAKELKRLDKSKKKSKEKAPRKEEPQALLSADEQEMEEDDAVCKAAGILGSPSARASDHDLPDAPGAAL